MTHYSRRQFLATLGASAAVLMLPKAAPAQGAAKKPNIVYILADDLGVGDVGCYGQQTLKTPNLDRLAAEGMRFTNAYAGSMVCAPSRCALMTGKHMGHATVRNNWEVYPEGNWPLKKDDVTIAQVLKGAGYATGLCGKWGLGSPGSISTPGTKGFDYFFGYICQRHAHRFYTDYLYRNTERIELTQSPEKKTYAQDLIADESLKFIRDHKEGPFFLYCAWTVPHGGYTADNVPSIEQYKNTDWTEAKKCYAAMVERLDSDLGRVMAQLKELGLDENTLVIFASDNGVQNASFGGGAGLRGAKATLFEGGLRIPQIARWTGRIAPGSVCAMPTCFYDFPATAAELAGAALPGQTDGISILPALLGREQKRHEYLYWEQPNPQKLVKAVRLGDWKGLQSGAGEPVELYDLKADPGEQTNVAAANPEVVKRIEKIMTEAHVDTEIPKPDPRVWTLYAEDNAKLDAKLGIKRAAAEGAAGKAKKKAGKKKAGGKKAKATAPAAQ